MDVQLWGSTLLLRRHLSYEKSDLYDVGHLFEKACTKQTNTILLQQNQQQQIHSQHSNDTREKQSYPFRGIVEGKLGDMKLLTSGQNTYI